MLGSIGDSVRVSGGPRERVASDFTPDRILISAAIMSATEGGLPPPRSRAPGGGPFAAIFFICSTRADGMELHPGSCSSAFNHVPSIGPATAGTGQAFALATNLALHSGSI